jgi:XTP/dITP diphosphohydrolase
LVLATRNAGKLGELRARLAGLPVVLLAAGDLGAPDVPEVADSLGGNALLKAEALHAFTGLPALADDTGLEVDAFGGSPGVHSARYAGPEADEAANRALLLASLQAVSTSAGRRARFRTVLAFVDDAGSHLFEGVCEGTITEEEVGTEGFGYDPIFLPDEQPAWTPPRLAGAARTFAQMTKEEKNRISHRGRALDAFAAFLAERMG